MYNFKKNTKVFLVKDGLRHKLEIYPDLSVSQTFDEQGYKRKTLHTLADLHEHAVIVKANPANFSMTVPIFDQATIQKELELSCDYSGGQAPSFDLYIESDFVIYKLEKCVFETTTFNLDRAQVHTASLTGSASKITKVTSIPGTLQATPTRQFVRIDTFSAKIGTTTLDFIASANIEIANDIEWQKNDTVNAAVAGVVSYPQNYVLTGRRGNGSFTQFLTDVNKSELSDYSTIVPIELKVNNNLLVFELPSAVFTRREETGDLFTRIYDFRLNVNSAIVKPIYKGV
jgi:hypothetical protein